MYSKVIAVTLYVIYLVSGSGIYHENTKITFSPPYDAELFGYSVVLNKFGLIVGAPKARERNKQTGAAYNCSLGTVHSPYSSNISCTPLGITLRSSRIIPVSFYKDDMWYGATIASLSDGKTLYCAPRFTEPYGSNHLLIHGECAIQRGNRFTLTYPLLANGRQAFMTDGKRREYGDYGTHLNFYAYGQAGMSIKVLENKASVIIGAPGLLQWTGGIISFSYKASEASNYFSKQVISNPYYTPELGPDEYFGYSVEAGDFLPDKDTLYIGGAPRSLKGYGQVLIFEPALREQNPLKIHAKLRGPQLGSYFGASLCCLDIDGDGFSDLLVGAPTYVKKDGGLPYDQGAVFVYMTTPLGNKFNLTESGFVMGSGASGARFGTAMADLGDVDGDGFTDVAIGAPWENDGAGVVYIYRGSSNGLMLQYVQRIQVAGARSFGLAISKGLDVDHNNCNDLAIGAALSTTTYLYRCVPTVSIKPTINVPNAMNLPHGASNFTALFCLTASVRKQWPHVKAGFTTRIVVDPEESRAKISDDESSEYNVTISPGETRCDERTIEVKPTADLSKPILLKFFLHPAEIMRNDSTEFNYHAARVSEDSVLETSFHIQLMWDCGEDMICTPWLEMSLEPFDTPYVPGSTDVLGARLTVLNTEEPAYGVKVNITLPLIPKRIPSPCSLEELIMTCKVPAPLFRNENVSWDIELEYKESVDTDVKMEALLFDEYGRNISNQSIVEVEMEIHPVAIFNVAGKPLPNETLAVAREKLNKGAGDVLFSHYYEISNSGPSSWLNTELTIILPAMTSLSNPIKDCLQEGNSTKLYCVWSMTAKDSRSLVLPLRFDAVGYGEFLKHNESVDFEEEIKIHLKTDIVLTNAVYGNRTASVTTTLVIGPAPPTWPLILGIVAGLVLLAALVFSMYKCGFFSRQQRERLKKLKDGQTVPLTEPDVGSSTGPPSVVDESSQELLFDSD